MPSLPDTHHCDVAIVGAGFAGLHMLHRLRSMGLSARVIEAAAGVGGVWTWNRYPGARCDVESLQYSYSFSPELEQEWVWSEKYAAQPEILRYLEHVADRFDLRRDIEFNARVVSAHYLQAHGRWQLRTDNGLEISAQFCVMASGALSLPRLPDIDGIGNFCGKVHHTGAWPHQGVDLRGQRVGIIGTGSSGIQAIPAIARRAARLTVFQRTANFSIPAWNAPLQDGDQQAWKRDYRMHRLRARELGTLYEFSDKAAWQATETERSGEFERRWNKGGVNFVHAYSDLMVNQRSNDSIADFVRAKIRSIVRDPAVAESLCPNDHPLGTKRICVDSGYFETFNRDNVLLVDLKKTPIQEITSHGIRAGDTLHAIDTLVCATGYDALTGALLNIDIRGLHGRTLKDHWANGPRTYLGLMASGFPNLFMVTGAGSPSVLVNMVVGIEQHVEWIGDAIGHLRAAGRARNTSPPPGPPPPPRRGPPPTPPPPRGRRPLGGACEPSGQPDAAAAGQLLVSGRQHTRKAKGVHALRGEDRRLPKGVPGHRRRWLPRLRTRRRVAATGLKEDAISPDRYLRSFDVLGLLVRHKEGLRLTEIKDALGLPVSSLHNMLQTMVAAEMLSASDDLRYAIGPRAVGIALAIVGSLDVRTLARRHLLELAREIGDDVYLAMQLGRRIFYADRCIGTQRISLDIRLGESLSLHATATGKLFCAYDSRLASRALAAPLKRLTARTITDAGALQAELARIRANGYSKSNEEAVDGIVGYAVPVLQTSGALAAAIHVSVIGGRATRDHERALVSAARECALHIERSLGHVRPNQVHQETP